MPKRLTFALTLMGFTSLVVQTLLIREFIITFYGNELTIGIILANWILVEALGSRLTSRFSSRAERAPQVYAILQTGISIYLPISIFLIRTIKNLLGLTLGEGVGILPIFFSSFFILAPLGFMDGAQFPFGCRLAADSSKKPLESVGKVYILEALGFILAGPLFTYLLIVKLDSFSIAFLLGFVNLLSAMLILKDRLSYTITKYLFIAINLLLIAALFSFFGPASKLQKFSIDKQWKGQDVLSYRNSVYGNLVVTKSKGQYTFYNDGIPIITVPMPDIIFVEDISHFTMLNHPNPKDVLLLSGGAGGLINEMLKYDIEKLTYTELDPSLIKLVRDFPTELTAREIADRRLDIKHIDGRRFLRARIKSPAAGAAAEKYDVIITNLPMPTTLQLNRFYTKEFFTEVRSVLRAGGIFAFSLPGSLSYISDEMRRLNGSILNTLEDVFYVKVIPGDFNIYLASARPFEISAQDILKRLEDKKINTRLLNKQYLEYRLNKSWDKWFRDSMAGYANIRKNFDLLPSGTFYAISYWNALFSQRLKGVINELDRLKFGALFWMLASIGITLFVLKTFVLKSKRPSVGFAIFTTGFAGMSFNLILIYAYQSFFGFVFHNIAILVTAFMAGLTLGGLMMNRSLAKVKDDVKYFSKIEAAIVLFSIFLGFALICVRDFAQIRFSFIFFILSAASGFLVGLEFPLANKLYWHKRGSSEAGGMLYALDLGGAWLAALIVSFILVPVIGIVKTCALLAVLKVSSLTLVASAPGLNSTRQG